MRSEHPGSESDIRMRSSKGGSEAAATSAMAARRVESKEHVSDASGDRISRLGNRPEARRSMLELPDSLPLSSGTVNFMIFAMALAMGTTCIENYFHSGAFLEFETFAWLLQNLHIGLGFWLVMVLWSYLCYAVTVITIKKKIPMILGEVAYAFLQMALFTGITGLLFVFEFSPLMRMATGAQICVHAMKAHSFWATNWTYHDALALNKLPDLNDHDLKNFPNNLKIATYSYFLFAPTLTFETEFPRTPKMSWKRVIEYAIMFLLAALAIYIVLTYNLMPAWRLCNAKHPDGVAQVFRFIIQLSLPTMALWMLLFYAVFHCLLNFFAEIMCYADREFYQDWWNAESFDVWWRKWNRPVHRWMLRHIYHDWMHVTKGSRRTATFITFLVSAVLHEFVVSVAFGMFRPILSGSMLLQIGLIALSKNSIFKGTQVGNVIMWMTVFFGQPMVEVMYCYAYNHVFN